MMKSMIFRIIAGLAGIYHLLLGAALCWLPTDSLTGVARVFLGARLEFNPQLTMAARFSSSYLLAFGIMMLLLCFNPVRFRVLLLPALVLFGVRLINKLFLLGAIEQTFDVTRGRSVFAIGTLALIFGLLAFSAPRSGETRDS